MGISSSNHVKLSDTSSGIARIVELMSRYGPDIQRIANETGVHQETVRYRYRRFLLQRGFTVRAVPDYEKLGMKRLIMIVSISESLEGYTDALLLTMHELCYVRSSQKVMFSPDYILHVDCPEELIDGCRGVLMRLKEFGLFSKVEIFEFDTVRVPPMKAKMYDFVEEFWSYQWRPTAEKRGLTLRSISSRVAYDYTDVLILKELTVDATKQLITIARMLGVKYKTLSWHYKHHVMGRELIRAFDVNWCGSNSQDGKEAHPTRQKALPVSLLLRDASEAEKLKMMLLLNPLPFLAFEAAGPGHYFATLRLPPQEHTEALEHISSFLQSCARKCTFFIIDESRSVEFPLPYQLFNRDSKRWQLDEKGVYRSSRTSS